jgi:hypothetical protein
MDRGSEESMRHAIVLAALLAVCGCHNGHIISGPAHRRAVYVHDHRCQEVYTRGDYTAWDDVTGKIYHWPGFKVYLCPGIDPITIHDNEEQP